MIRGTATVAAIAAAALLAGCGGDRLPWGRFGAPVEAPRIPPGAKAYACEGGKRLLVRYADDAKSAMVIYPEREFRLDRVPSASGEQFSNGRTILATRGDEATLEESGAVQFAKCKLERAP